MVKRGISPLIATVLIIGFTVVLAALILTWGNRFVQDIQEETDVSTQTNLRCGKVNFDVKSLKCESGEFKSVTIENNYEGDIVNFVVRIRTVDGEFFSGETSNFVIPSFQSKTLIWIYVSADPAPVEPSQIELLPKIVDDFGNEVVCTGVGLELNIYDSYDNGNCRISAAPTCTDDDGDGYGNPTSSYCSNPGLDCNDGNSGINPGASEVCTSSTDYDCDGAAQCGDSDCDDQFCNADETRKCVSEICEIIDCETQPGYIGTCDYTMIDCVSVYGGTVEEHAWEDCRIQHGGDPQFVCCLLSEEG